MSRSLASAFDLTAWLASGHPGLAEWLGISRGGQRWPDVAWGRLVAGHGAPRHLPRFASGPMLARNRSDSHFISAH